MAYNFLNLSLAGRRYGYRKDLPDFRDYGVSSAPLVAAKMSARSNIGLLGPVLDQGQEGSCTAHAAAADREFLHWKQIEQLNQPVTPGPEGLYSPAYIYALERVEDGTFDQGDVGSYGRTSCKVLNLYGCALRSDFPYVAGQFSTLPTQAQIDAAKKWPTGGYHRLTTVDDMKSVIATGYCFRVGFTVLESFEDIGSDGLWNPKMSEIVLGGHEVLAFAYNDDVNGGCFQIRNSWGPDWGDAGNFWMRYEDAANPDILQDSWLQHLGHWNR